MLHKRFLLGAASLVFSAAVISAPALAQTPAAEATEAQAPAAAAESILLLHINVEGLVKSELYKQLQTTMGDQLSSTDPNYLQFRQATGFNPETDLRSITVGAAGELGTGNPDIYAILKGKFDRAKVEAYARGNDKFTVGEREGLTTFTSTEREGGQEPPTFALLDDNTMIAASTQNFDRLATSTRGGGRVPASPRIADLIGEKAAGQIQLAMLLPEVARTQLAANPQSAPLADVQTFLLALDVTKDVNVLLQATAGNDEQGKNVHDALNGFVALGRMMSAEQPDVQKILGDLKLEQKGATTQLALAIKADQLTQLLGQAMAVANIGMGGSAETGGEPAADDGEEETDAEEEADDEEEAGDEE
jgi:hypothetical protein